MTRVDNRANDELRPLTFTLHYTAYAEGSVLIETGNTRVLCNATIEESVPVWRQPSGQGWVTAEYGMLPRSTHRRIARSQGSDSSRAREIQRLIGRSLRAAVDLAGLGPRTITVDCDVIQADGGTRTASITGGYIAVVLALRRLIEAGVVSESVLLTPVAAVSVGLVGGEALLDLAYTEDSTAEVDLNVVMTGGGQFVEVQGTAESQPFSRAALESMLDLAWVGIERLLAEQLQILG